MQRQMKVDKVSEVLGFCWFRLPRAVVEMKTGELK